MENHVYYLRPQGRGIKLHLGCGDYWYDGYLNIDIGIFGGTDMLYDIRQKLPFQDSVVEIIQAHDVVEHFNEDEIASMLDDWNRVLINGGKIIITLPEVGNLLKQYADKPLEGLLPIYGFYGEHKWGYTKESIKELFEKHKFKVILVEDTIVEGKDDGCPRMKLECEK